MFGLLGSGIFGSLFGGLFRLIPEILKYFDKGNERAHELEMFREQCELEKVRGQIKMADAQESHQESVDDGVLAAFNAAIKQQADMAVAAGGWAASLSASVRPVLTYYLLALYGLVKMALYFHALAQGQAWDVVLPRMWGADDMALLSGAVNYWLLDRTLGKRGL